MEIPVFFFEAIHGDLLTLNEETSKHVVQVLRMKQGEKLQLTDGTGNLAIAEIIDDHKKKCSVKIIDRSFVQQKEKRVSIAISLLKNNSRFEWFLEKATEIGVSEIIPIICSRTEKHHFRYERMRQILISAMIQSKQAWLPVLHEPIAYENVCSSSDYDTRLIAHCLEEEKNIITEFSNRKSVQIMIGPEGDFTKDEIDLALAQGYNPVTLGETRLRAETAGVVAATLLCI